MARGGAGRGQGRRKGSPNKKKITNSGDNLSGNIEILPPLPDNPVMPLDHMLRVLNDPNATQDRKDRMASIAAPFCHARADIKGGKKQEKDEAARLAAGRFAPGSGPKIVPIRQQG